MPAETTLGPTLEDGAVPVTRVEQFNQLVRAIVVLALTFGVLHGFIYSKVVSTESFLIIAIMVFTWWFKSRDEEKKPTTQPTNGGATR